MFKPSPQYCMAPKMYYKLPVKLRQNTNAISFKIFSANIVCYRLVRSKNYKKNVKLSKVQYVQCNFVLC